MLWGCKHALLIVAEAFCLSCDQVLKCLLQLVQNFPGLPEAKISGKCKWLVMICYPLSLFLWRMGQFFAAVLAPLWQTFVSSFKVYQLSMIQASEDVDSVGYDSDGSERSLESFGIQVISCISVLLKLPFPVVTFLDNG